MSHDADYFRARAMEERDRARDARRVYLATLHRDLAAQLDRKAWECEEVGGQPYAHGERRIADRHA
ncbi:MAG TPA: hypothetical protein VFK50_04170 [Sphingomicrobium sp.]|nr:hypothetical protein [Sphingomicrobium sp.]